MKNLLSFILLILTYSSIYSQIISIDPSFPSRDEMITITYDASQGNGGLENVNQVYMHTGLITSLSSSGSDWKYVIGNWGTEDDRVKMTNIGDNKHQISYIINDFYGIPTSEMIERLAFVFRNVDGSKEGKTASQGDIFLDYEESTEFTGQLLTPTESTIIVSEGESINIQYITSEVADISVSDNGTIIYQESTNNLEYNYLLEDTDQHTIEISANNNGSIKTASFGIIVNPDINIEAYPDGTHLGINKINNTDYRFVLFAPGKSNAYIVGDFTDWNISPDYFMNKSPDGQSFWIDINNLSPDNNYAFQYLVDGNIRIADPFSELVLDPSNDASISESTFPNMHPYPTDLTQGHVSLVKTNSEDYEWKNQFSAHKNEDLVIYELLMRDFTNEKNYQTILDTLDYLQSLGINAIELMPINEFEGNQSWGYNPSFHMALDKYYGTPESFKALIDECHKRSIAVILDVVFNHAFSQSPIAQLYWDSANFRPSEDSPFLNVTAKHPFNVGYDFNHESEATQKFVNHITSYWVNEYNIDGFRFDLSKGFTQKESDNDETFKAYDAQRIDVLKNYADNIWAHNPDAYIILEHFAANDEETELSDYGMMLWSNHNFNFNEATMGYNSDGKSNFEWIDYKKKGWSKPHAIGYMESHDEERLMFKNLSFGNGNSDYSVKELSTAIERMQMATVFFYGIPGPKMLWQFGEMGYDFSINTCEDGSINENCRLSPKPIKWDYKDDLDRKKLIDVTSAMIKLKRETELMNSTAYSHNLLAGLKFIKLNTATIDGMIVGNFDIIPRTIEVNFNHTGIWYDYLEGEELEIANTEQTIDLAPGEFHVYLDKIVDPVIISGIQDQNKIINDYNLYPNPSNGGISFDISIDQADDGKILIYDNQSKLVYKDDINLNAGNNHRKFSILDLHNGLYHVVLEGTKYRITDRLSIQK